MKISRDPQSRHWLLSSDTRVLYSGPKSPWDHPSILREALQREAEGRAADPRAPRPQAATRREQTQST